MRLAKKMLRSFEKKQKKGDPRLAVLGSELLEAAYVTRRTRKNADEGRPKPLPANPKGMEGKTARLPRKEGTRALVRKILYVRG